jgi:hypothetical protein
MDELLEGKDIYEQFEALLPWQKAIIKLINPEYLKKVLSHHKSGSRFVHYTSAENLIKIIRKEEIWMRRVGMMNDFRETAYGVDLLIDCYNSSKGQKFRKSMINMFGGEWKKFEGTYNFWDKNNREDTYIACFSEHRTSEDNTGRLSMWRCYGKGAGVALVLKPKPFHTCMSAVGPSALPVFYKNNLDFSREFFGMCNRIRKNIKKFPDMDADKITNIMFEKFLMYSFATKHRGFSEELEWRLVYCPKMDEGGNVNIETETLNGVPQRICKFKLKNDPEKNIYGIEIADLVDRIIIGPTEYSSNIKDAICLELIDRGIENPERIVFQSDIPFRNNQ